MFDLIYSLMMSVVYILAALLVIILYRCFVHPYYIRWKYRRYPNVKMSKWHFPIFGDFINYQRDIDQGKVYYYHLKDDSEELSNCDIRLEILGSKHAFKIVSQEAHRQFDELHPDKIDRICEKLGAGKIFPNAFGNIRCTKSFTERRTLFMKVLSLNSSSRYIPAMLKCCEEVVNKWKVGGTYGSIFEMNTIAFLIFTHVMFGEDTHHVAEKRLDYEDANGVIQNISLKDFFINVIRDFMNGWSHFVTLVAPFLNQYNLVNPFRRNQRNFMTFRKALLEAIESSKDKNSICQQVFADKTIDKEIIFEDLFGFMFAGTETSSHSMTSALYYLYKNPDKLAILLKELEDAGLKRFEKHDDLYTLDKLQELNYLHYVVKEALRLDGPAFVSLDHYTYDDVTI